MKLNKQNWNEVTIGFVADEIKEKILSPENSGRDKFIRLEDLEIGDMYVKKYRNPEDIGSGKFCNDGDILFARRSVSVTQFKRRSCIVTFDAICSDELTVIREKKGNLVNGFLNLLLNTTNLWDYSISRSVGSVSKRIKWKDLTKYTFLLPPLEEQERIAALFQSIESAIEQTEAQEGNLKALQKDLSNGLVDNPPVFGNLLSDENCKTCKFGDATDCIEQHDKKPLENGITRFIGLENIEPENFDLQGFGNIENGTTFTKRFATGDVLFGKRRAYLKKVAVSDFDGICSGDILVLRAKEKFMLPDLLPYYVSSEAFIKHAVSTSAGSLSPRTKWRDLSGFELSIPDIKTQNKILDVFNQLRESHTLIKKQINVLKTLKQNLLNRIFE